MICLRNRRRSIGAALAAIALAAAGLFFPLGEAQARPLTPAEKRFSPYTGIVPHCSDASVLGRIQSRFSSREQEYWHTGREIQGFNRVRQIGYRSAGRDLIPRRYCSARASFNDGRIRWVSYWIGEDLGMAGQNWALEVVPGNMSPSVYKSYGVEWCVHGLDYNRAFGANCSAARP